MGVFVYGCFAVLMTLMTMLVLVTTVAVTPWTVVLLLMTAPLTALTWQAFIEEARVQWPDDPYRRPDGPISDGRCHCMNCMNASVRKG